MLTTAPADQLLSAPLILHSTHTHNRVITHPHTQQSDHTHSDTTEWSHTLRHHRVITHSDTTETKLWRDEWSSFSPDWPFLPGSHLKLKGERRTVGDIIVKATTSVISRLKFSIRNHMRYSGMQLLRSRPSFFAAAAGRLSIWAALVSAPAWVTVFVDQH